MITILNFTRVIEHTYPGHDVVNMCGDDLEPLQQLLLKKHPKAADKERVLTLLASVLEGRACTTRPHTCLKFRCSDAYKDLLTEVIVSQYRRGCQCVDEKGMIDHFFADRTIS